MAYEKPFINTDTLAVHFDGRVLPLARTLHSLGIDLWRNFPSDETQKPGFDPLVYAGCHAYWAARQASEVYGVGRNRKGQVEFPKLEVRGDFDADEELTDDNLESNLYVTEKYLVTEDIISIRLE